MKPGRMPGILSEGSATTSKAGDIPYGVVTMILGVVLGWCFED
jgi:hypothetical protein